MTHNDYVKITVTRGSFNKKGLLHVLCSFFDYSQINHDVINKTYSFSSSLLTRFDESNLVIFCKLIKKFSLYHEVIDNTVIIKYAW